MPRAREQTAFAEVERHAADAQRAGGPRAKGVRRMPCRVRLQRLERVDERRADERACIVRLGPRIYDLAEELQPLPAAAHDDAGLQSEHAIAMIERRTELIVERFVARALRDVGCNARWFLRERNRRRRRR